MQFGHFLFRILKEFSLITWYLDSPQTASHGMRIANCTSFSPGCIEAAQDAVRDLKQCQTLEYFANQKAEREETFIKINNNFYQINVEVSPECKALLDAAAFHAPNRQQTACAMLFRINQWLEILWYPFIAMVVSRIIIVFFRGPIDAQAPDSGAAEAL